VKIALGADHRGYKLKEQLKQYLQHLGYTVIDTGPDTAERVDYPDYALAVAQLVAKGKASRGILICATGIGMSITANKLPRIRAALCTSVEMARRSREHNNANILCLGADLLNLEQARKMVRVWLTTDFARGRHNRRLRKISAIESALQRDKRNQD